MIIKICNFLNRGESSLLDLSDIYESDDFWNHVGEFDCCYWIWTGGREYYTNLWAWESLQGYPVVTNHIIWAGSNSPQPQPNSAAEWKYLTVRTKGSGSADHWAEFPNSGNASSHSVEYILCEIRF
mgnify:CR=1 FL=1